ncbi:hypothetical protein ZEAMMB73_Zm00001d007816 [Zea mays]|uniref:Uncharacterized protein n=1 Tax=Zea mays TaxID=4577 RepID=A0A1D6F935_MAIZE|nr:hypothetical protein ZEAMMB73_Zm00001d007816 [Zea mays]
MFVFWSGHVIWRVLFYKAMVILSLLKDVVQSMEETINSQRRCHAEEHNTAQKDRHPAITKQKHACQSAVTCNKYNILGHFAAECTSKPICWNFKEPEHIASESKDEALCHTSIKIGHLPCYCPTSWANV